MPRSEGTGGSARVAGRRTNGASQTGPIARRKNVRRFALARQFARSAAPDEMIKEDYLIPLGMSVSALA
jgi:hypothetical protein